MTCYERLRQKTQKDARLFNEINNYFYQKQKKEEEIDKL